MKNKGKALLVVILFAAVSLTVAFVGPSVLPPVIGAVVGALVTIFLMSDKAGYAPATQGTPELPTVATVPADEAEEPTSVDQLEATSKSEADPLSQPEASSEAPSESHADTPPKETQPAPERPTVEPARAGLDMKALGRALFFSSEPLEVLRLAVRDIKSRKTNASLAPICTIPKRPTGAELYLMRMLVEAGLLDGEGADPEVHIVKLSTSGLFYIRVSDQRLPYPTLMRLLRVESALNVLQMASDGMGDLSSPSLEDMYVLFQRIVGSIEAEPLPAFDDDGDGEWALRHHISRGLEAARLPFRLRADFRSNLAEGRVGFELAFTPPEAFPSSAAIPDIGIVPSTSDMRNAAARDYNLRIAHLVAAIAFCASERVREVMVAGVLDTPNRHECLYSVRFDRERFELIDLAAGIDPVASALSFGATLQDDGRLSPVEQGFSLSDEELCPARRYVTPERSSRTLDERAAKALGTRFVSGLSVDEADRRVELSELIMRGLGASTSDNVSLILSLVADDSDPSVHLAAERTVAKLIDGSLDEDPEAVAEEFCDGDALTRAVVRAQNLLEANDPEGAEQVLSRALRPFEAEGTYDDSPTVRYRSFAGYPERVLYNRLLAGDETTLLVPQAYPWAVVLLSLAQLMQGRPEEALVAARRGVELCPLSSHARLHLAQCLEACGDVDAAIQSLIESLEYAHDGFGVGFAYYRLAFILWQRGDASGAQACYKRGLRYAPIAVVPIPEGADRSQLPSIAALKSMTIDKRDDKVLTARSIPLAPTKRVRKALDEAARAALDAELFPVARSLMQVIGEMTRDDVTNAILRSIEGEPDR